MPNKKKTIKTSVFTCIFISAMAAGVNANAQNYVQTIPARVIAVNPIWQNGGNIGSNINCQPVARPLSDAGVAVSAIVGGLIGSQLGKGGGRTAGALLGTAAGASLGYIAQSDAYNNNYNNQCAYSQQNYNNTIIGYNVDYELNGQIYSTQTNYPPNGVIHVQVPVYQQAYSHSYPQAGNSMYNAGNNSIYRGANGNSYNPNTGKINRGVTHHHGQYPQTSIQPQAVYNGMQAAPVLVENHYHYNNGYPNNRYYPRNNYNNGFYNRGALPIGISLGLGTGGRWHGNNHWNAGVSLGR